MRRVWLPGAALTLDHKVPDCLYLALAEREGAVFRFPEFGDGPPEEPFDRLLSAEWRLVSQARK